MYWLHCPSYFVLPATLISLGSTRYLNGSTHVSGLGTPEISSAYMFMVVLKTVHP